MIEQDVAVINDDAMQGQLTERHCEVFIFAAKQGWREELTDEAKKRIVEWAARTLSQSTMLRALSQDITEEEDNRHADLFARIQEECDKLMGIMYGELIPIGFDGEQLDVLPVEEVLAEEDIPRYRKESLLIVVNQMKRMGFKMRSPDGVEV